MIDFIPNVSYQPNLGTLKLILTLNIFRQNAIWDNLKLKLDYQI